MILKMNASDFLLEIYHRFEANQSDKEITEFWNSVDRIDVPGWPAYELTEEQMRALREDVQVAVKVNRSQMALNIQKSFQNKPYHPKPSRVIHKFLWAAKDSEEQGKANLKRYYFLRATDEEMFGNRDPLSPDAQKLHASSQFVCLPTLTKDLYRISLSVLTDYDPESFYPVEWVRRVFYIADLRVRDEFCLGDVMIYDLQGFTIKHLVKFDFGLTRRMIQATEAAVPTRIKEIHMINCPPFMDKVTAVFKPFLKAKIAERVIFHFDGYEELYKYIPKNNLPEEYGGTAGSLPECIKLWREQLEKNRNWFISEEKEIKRIYLEGKKAGKLFQDTGDMFGVDGSFKQLALD